MTKKTALKTNYVLIDFENRPAKSIALLTGEQFRVYLFLDRNNNKVETELAMEMHSLSERATYVKLESPDTGPQKKLRPSGMHSLRA